MLDPLPSLISHNVVMTCILAAVLTVAGCCWNETSKGPAQAIGVTVAAHTIGPGGTKRYGSGQGSQGAVSLFQTGKVDWVCSLTMQHLIYQ